MRRGCFIATAAGVAALVVVLGLLAAQYLPGLIPASSGREMLSEWIEENTNAELAAGYVAPLFLPGLGVQVRDFELKLKNGDGGSERFFSAKAIKVVADTSELIRGRRIVWKEIIVEDPRIWLVRGGDGKWNAARWIREMPVRKKGEAKPSQSADQESVFVWMIKDSLKRSLPTTGGGLEDLLRMERVEVSNANVSALDLNRGKKIFLAPVNLAGVNFRFDGAYGDQPARFSASLPFPQTSGSSGPVFSFNGTIRAYGSGEISVTSLSGKWPGISINSLSGVLKLSPKFSFDANLDLTASFPAVKRAAMWPPLARSKTIPDMEGQGSGRVKLHAWGPAPQRAAKVHYQGTLELFGMTWDPGRVIAPLQDISATIYLEDGQVRMPETLIRLAGTRVRGGGVMTESRTPRFDIDAATDFVDFKKLFRPRRTRLKAGQPMMGMMTRWGGHVFIKQGVYNKIEIADAKGNWDVTNKRFLTFPELRFNACGGSYTESGRSWVDFNHPTDTRFRFDGRIRGMDMTSFTDQLFNTTTFLHGMADADGFITGRFVSGEFVTRDLNGDLDITVRDGFFKDFNLVGKILTFFKLPAPSELADMKFRTMSSNVRFDRGVAYLTNLKVDSAALSGEAQGWIDFATHNTDLKIKLNFLGPFALIMKGLPLVGIVTGPAGEAVSTLYVRAYGDWDHLQYAAWNPLDNAPPSPPELPAPPTPQDSDTAGQ
ncbi:MAG TPA: AsmA-like C-terminal region-containing protein [bacterium]|nr:AsmA-like C-terminal region-containing protein [bacterium]